MAATRAAAEQAVQGFGLADDVDLIFDEIRYEHTASADSSGDGTATPPRVREAIVTFRQVINDVPVVSPGRGEVRVRVDGSGTVTTVTDTSRLVSDLAERENGTIAPPPSGHRGVAESVVDEKTADDALDRAVQRRLRAIVASGPVPESVRTIRPTEIGYDLQARSASVVARRTVEVDCGAGLRKRYVVQVPVIE
jgi:hypothetical protein